MQEKRDLPFTYDEFREIYSKVPRLCVEVIIKTDKGIVLLLRKKHGWEGLWHLPGSTVYYKEPIEKAVERIASEETGVTVRIEKFLGFAQYPSEEKIRGFGYSVSLMFLCTVTMGEFLCDEDSSELREFSQMPDNMVHEEQEFIRSHSSDIF